MVRYYTSVALSDIKSEHFQWFRDMAVAQAKKILSRIRGKFSGAVPAPAGNLMLDYKELAEEGRQEESDLLKELKRKVPSVPPMFG